MDMKMIFSVVEVKQLGRGFSRSLSVRFEGEYEGIGTAQAEGLETVPARFTIHAVLPFDPEYGNLQIGNRFVLERASSLLAEAVPGSVFDGRHVPFEKSPLVDPPVLPRGF